MSLLSTDFYRLSIAPGHVALLHMQKRFSLQVLTQTESKLADAVDIAAVLQAVEQLLAGCKAGRKLEVVLSNHYLRYRLLAVPAEGMAARELQALAAASYREAYGEVADAWLVRCQPWLGEQQVLATAMDASLLAQLQQLSQQYQLHLRSVQPYLMAGFNQVAKQIRQANAGFLQVESGRATLALFSQQQWQAIRSLPLAPQANTESMAEELRTLVSRELLLAGWDLAQATLYLDSAQQSLLSRLGEGVPWQVQLVAAKPVAGYKPLAGDFHMAMQGAA